MTANDVKKLLGLSPHPREGGWFVRTYEAPEFSSDDSGRYDSPRRTGTAIYYLLEPETFSEMHCLASDEIFHHYLGSAVEMLLLRADGNSERVVLGKDLAADQRPQVVVERCVWQGARLLEPEGFALLGCTVSPGFEFADYSSGDRAKLLAKWPQQADLIHALTKE